MEPDYRNIYRDARQTAGLTQERWAELLGISADSVRQYETDRMTPSDEVVLRMAEAAGQQIICYWHMVRKSRIAAKLLPELDRAQLPEAVLALLVKIRDFAEDGMMDLTRIAADGRVDLDEREPYEYAMRQLRELISAGLTVEYAERKED